MNDRVSIQRMLDTNKRTTQRTTGCTVLTRDIIKHIAGSLYSNILVYIDSEIDAMLRLTYIWLPAFGT